MSGVQAYWRIRRADGSYFAGHMLEGSHLRVLWSSVSVARTYDRKPIGLEHIVKDDPTARVVRVTVRRARERCECGIPIAQCSEHNPWGAARRRSKPMIESDWEAGQALIRCADELLEQEKDLREAGYRKLASVLRDARLTIGDTFNALGSHDFALAGRKPAKPTRRRKP